MILAQLSTWIFNFFQPIYWLSDFRHIIVGSLSRSVVEVVLIYIDFHHQYIRILFSLHHSQHWVLPILYNFCQAAGKSDITHLICISRQPCVNTVTLGTIETGPQPSPHRAQRPQDWETLIKQFLQICEGGCYHLPFLDYPVRPLVNEIEWAHGGFMVM